MSDQPNPPRAKRVKAPRVDRGAQLVKTLTLVGLVAGTIAAGAVAAKQHFESNGNSHR